MPVKWLQGFQTKKRVGQLAKSNVYFIFYHIVYMQVLTAPGQHLVQEGGQLQVVEAAVVGGVAGVGAIGAIAEGTQDAVAQAVAQATGLEQHEVSVQGMSVQEQVDKAISNAVAWGLPAGLL